MKAEVVIKERCPTQLIPQWKGSMNWKYKRLSMKMARLWHSQKKMNHRSWREILVCCMDVVVRAFSKPKIRNAINSLQKLKGSRTSSTSKMSVKHSMSNQPILKSKETFWIVQQVLKGWAPIAFQRKSLGEIKPNKVWFLSSQQSKSLQRSSIPTLTVIK